MAVDNVLLTHMKIWEYCWLTNASLNELLYLMEQTVARVY